MALLSEFQSEAEMLADADAPTKLVRDDALTLQVVLKPSLALPHVGINLPQGTHDLDFSVRFAELEPTRPKDLPDSFDEEMTAEVMAEFAELDGMDDRVEVRWSGRASQEGWEHTQRLGFSELIGLDSNLATDWIWWSQAPSSWCQAFEQEMIVRGAPESFLDDTVILPCVIDAEKIDLWLKFVAPCMDLAILRGGTGDAFLVRMRGLIGSDGDGLPPFVGSVDVASLLGLTPQDTPPA